MWLENKKKNKKRPNSTKQEYFNKCLKCRCSGKPKWFKVFFFSLDWTFEPVRNETKEVGFCSFCGLIFCILMEYPRFDGIWRCVDSQLYNSSIVPLHVYNARACLYFILFYTLRKNINERNVIFDKKHTSDQLEVNLKKQTVTPTWSLIMWL